MKIGRLYIPDVDFPADAQQQLAAYMAATGDSCSYIAHIGVEEPDKTTMQPGLLRLHAAITELSSDPDNGLAALYVAGAFEELGQIEDTLAVLESLHAIGAPGCYTIPSENPAFLAGWLLIDERRHAEAIRYYQLALGYNGMDKAAVWGHLGTVHHELGEFNHAISYYDQVLAELKNPPVVTSQQSDPKRRAEIEELEIRRKKEQELFIQQLREAAAANRPIPNAIKRNQDGLTTA